MVLDDLEKAKILLENDRSRKTISMYFSRIYPFTTENLDGYFRQLDFKDKSILTPGSSADQIFNLIIHNASDINLFDINPFIKYYFNLKKTALQNLSMRKFIEFFHYKEGSNRKFINEGTYCKLSKYLDYDTKLFWDTLYSEYDIKTIRKKLFFGDEFQKKHIIQNNSYLQEGNYRLLRKKIDGVRINFIKANVIDLPIDNKKYDYLLLSNILDYLYGLLIIEEEEFRSVLYEYRSMIINLAKLLNDDGTMLFHYFWEYDKNMVYNLITRFFKDDNNVSMLEFPNAHHKLDAMDCVLTYKKTLK